MSPNEETKGTEGNQPATDDVIVERPFGAPNPTTYTTKGGRPLAADDHEGTGASSET
jgi:hypothetical protein